MSETVKTRKVSQKRRRSHSRRRLCWVILLVFGICAAGCSSDNGGENGGDQQRDAGLPDYECLTACDPMADAGASSCEPYEECHNTGAGGYCVPPEDVIVPSDVVDENYSCLTPCSGADAGSACRVPETCEAFNDQQSFCVPAEVPCDAGEIAVSGFGCLTLCNPETTGECPSAEECRALEGLDTGACYPVDGG